MFDDDIFEEEVNEELAKERAAEAERKRQEEAAAKSNKADNVYNSYGNSSNQNNGYNGPVYSSFGGNVKRGPQPQNSGMAIASFVLGLVALILFCACINVVPAIIAVVLGIVYLAKKNPVNRGFAIAGIVTGVLSLVLFFGSYAWIFSNDNLSELLDDDFIRSYYYEFNYDDDSEDSFEKYFEDLEDDDDFFSDLEDLETL